MPGLVILFLDAAAIVCVLMSLLCTWRGERPGLFGVLIWVFADTSAFANWRHALAPGAPPDALWLFPVRVAQALRRRNLALTEAPILATLQPRTPPNDGGWPVDLMRRIPVHTAAYRRWQAAWADLQEADHQAQDHDPQAQQPRRTMRIIAERHDMSVRQLQFVRRAGERGLLDAAIPPAVRLAKLSIRGDA